MLVSKMMQGRLVGPARGEKCNFNQAVGRLKLKTPASTQRGVAQRIDGNCTLATRITISSSSSNAEKLEAAPELKRDDCFGFTVTLSTHKNFRNSESERLKSRGLSEGDYGSLPVAVNTRDAFEVV